jgi:hypothetical protein
LLGGFEHRESILYLRRPLLWALLIGCVALCEVGVFWFAPAEWSVLRRALGGVVIGGWAFMCLFMNRMLVS